MSPNGLFIMIDGIDGAGKSTVIKTWSKYLENKGQEVFKLKDYWKEKQDFPEIDRLNKFDVIVSAEPTTLWIGKAIREEMIRSNSSYPPKSIAQAYALDRFVLYNKLHLPLLKQGKTILQDRGISTSLCYQSIQDTDLGLEDIADIEGNKFALHHNPNYLIIADVDVEKALERLGERYEKQDDSLFEKKQFLQKARNLFLDEDYQKLFTDKGAEVKVLDTNVNLDIMKESSINLLKNLK